MTPPYVNALCTSAASFARNWNAAPPTNTAAKIPAPLSTISGMIRTFSGVHSMSRVTSAYPRISAPWTIRPSLRSAKRSAATCASTGAGRTSSVSRVPSRTRRPSRSTEPSARSTSPKDVPAAPYSSAISGSV